MGCLGGKSPKGLSLVGRGSDLVSVDIRPKQKGHQIGVLQTTDKTR